MAESKFTKGPWVARESTTKNTFSIFSDSIFLAAAVGGFGPDDRTSLKETRANAELMADAPRLLEALRTLHDFALPLRERGLAAESEQAFADARALLEKHGG